jgi:hypothetical protein
MCRSVITDRRYCLTHGRGAGVGRNLGVTLGLAVGVGLGVIVGVAVAVAVGVEVGVAVGVDEAVAVGVGVIGGVALGVGEGQGIGAHPAMLIVSTRQPSLEPPVSLAIRQRSLLLPEKMAGRFTTVVMKPSELPLHA